MSADLTHAHAAPTDKAAMSFGPVLRLQRKCACGGDKCDSCSKKEKGLQAKLEVGASDDHFEREADRAADQVMNGGHALGAQAAPMQLQRVSDGASGLGEAPADVQQVLARPGVGLDNGTRSFFESRFGHDFASVRVHYDAQADASARGVGAKAYTVGSNVVFASGQYAPHSESGRRLMAHELAHVVQQGQGGARLQRETLAPCPATRTVTPAKNSKWRVLSREQIAKDARRKTAMDTIGESVPRAFSASMLKEKKDPQPLAAGTEVLIDEVRQGETVCQADGGVHATGSGVYKVNWSGPKAGSGFVYSPVLEEVKVTKLPTALDLKEARVCLVPPDIGLKFPLDLRLIEKQASIDFSQGKFARVDPGLKIYTDKIVNAKDKAEAEALLDGLSAPILYNFELPAYLKDDTERLKYAKESHPLSFVPWVEVTLLPAPFPGSPRFAFIEGDRSYTQWITNLINAPTVSRMLAPYFDTSVDPSKLKLDRDTAQVAGRVEVTLRDLNEPSRKRFDGRAMPKGKGVFKSWAQFDAALSAHVARERSINRLLDAKPRKTTGRDLDSIVDEQARHEPEADDDRVESMRSQKGAMNAEQKRRGDNMEASRKDAREKVEKTAASGKLTQGTPQDMLREQGLMVGESFGRGFMAGAEYEIPPDAWQDFARDVGSDLATFYVAVNEGTLYGAVKGIAAAFTDAADLAEMLGKLGYSIAKRQYDDLYDLIHDRERLLKRQKADLELIEKYAVVVGTAVWVAFGKFRADPGFMGGPAFDLGVDVGRSIGNTLEKKLGANASVRDKGIFVGEVIGRVAIEIIMNFIEPGKIIATGAARSGVKASKAAKSMEEAVAAVPELQDLLKTRKPGAKLADEAGDAKKGAGAKAPGHADEPSPKGAGDADPPRAKDAPESPDGKAGSKADDAKPAAKAEPELASESLPNGHAVEVNDRGICLCSEKPCPLMKKSLKKSLDNLPEHKKALDEAGDLAMKGRNDKAKAKEAAAKGKRVYEDVAKADPMEKWRAPYRRDMPKLRKDYADELKGDKMLGRIVDDLERRYLKDGKNTDSDLLDLVLKKLHEARSAKKKGPDPFLQDSAKAEAEWARRHKVGATGGITQADVADLEVFDDLSKFFGSTPAKSKLPTADAKAAGLLGDKGKPGSSALGTQEHGDASEVRSAYKVTGRDRQSAHIAATSFVKDVKGYKRDSALTVLMEPSEHKAFDDFWKKWSKDQRRLGRTHCTVAEMRTVMHQAIANLEKVKVPSQVRGAMAWLLDIEIASLQLRPEFKLKLPYPNVKKGSKP